MFVEILCYPTICQMHESIFFSVLHSNHVLSWSLRFGKEKPLHLLQVDEIGCVGKKHTNISWIQNIVRVWANRGEKNLLMDFLFIAFFLIYKKEKEKKKSKPSFIFSFNCFNRFTSRIIPYKISVDLLHGKKEGKYNLKSWRFQNISNTNPQQNSLLHTIKENFHVIYNVKNISLGKFYYIA